MQMFVSKKSFGRVGTKVTLYSKKSGHSRYIRDASSIHLILSLASA